MSSVAAFFGRLHPLMVHLPIGILFLAALFELLSFFPAYKNLRCAVGATLFWGALAASAAVATGLLLSQEGGYDERLLYLHRNGGIATAIVAWILFFARKRSITFFEDKASGKHVRLLFFIPLVGVLAFTGHLGGSLTHGEDYLFIVGDETAENSTPMLKVVSTTNMDSSGMYRDIVEPILRSRCYECHSEKKQKGKLRLDQARLIQKGGKHGSAIGGIVPDSSLIYSRLMLPLEDEHHMPPNEKPQLSSAEIALIHAWLAEGADFETKIAGYKNSVKIKSFVHSMVDKSTEAVMVPLRDVQAASVQSVEALSTLGILVVPISAGSNYLSVNFVNARSAKDADLKLLLGVKDQLVWLNLGRTAISDNSLEVLSKLTNLTSLNLEYTSIGDHGLHKLKSLLVLNTLNLVGTKVGDRGLLDLVEIKSLRKLFLYKTNVSQSGIMGLREKASAIFPDTGSYQLPVRITDTLEFRYN